MRGKLLAGAMIAAATMSLGAVALAQPGQSCFFITQMNGWNAPDDHTIYLNVSGGKIYRLDLAGACPQLHYPGASLVTHNNESSICSPLDWDLRVRDSGGFATPCIVKGMTQLTPDQAAALPRSVRP